MGPYGLTKKAPNGACLHGPYEAVFRNRAKEVGLSEPATERAVTLDIGTLGQFGFSANYIPGPGNTDEAH